jgi:tRNA pseudouridine65 synthase
LKHISCPIIGDVRYGKGEHNRYFRDQLGLHRLALHAASLMIDQVLITAPIPPDLAEPLLRWGLAPQLLEPGVVS